MQRPMIPSSPPSSPYSGRHTTSASNSGQCMFRGEIGYEIPEPVRFRRAQEEDALVNVAMMTRTALMAAVTAVAAQIAIPLPFSPVPFTLQVLAVILSGLLLGPRYGAL